MKLFVSILCFLALVIYSSGQQNRRTTTKRNAATTTTADKTLLKIQRDLFKIQDISELSKLGLMKKSRFVAVIDVPAGLEKKSASPGICDPKLVCIPNPMSLNVTSNSEFAFPPCINIHRCGGCCPSNEDCTPSSIKDVVMTNVGFVHFNNNLMTYSDSITIVQNHTSCECKCIYQNDDDCKKLNPNFIKDEFSCNCVCPNLYCGAFHEPDEKNCKCMCNRDKYSKIEAMCKQRGLPWNEDLCKCEIQAKRNPF